MSLEHARKSPTVPCGRTAMALAVLAALAATGPLRAQTAAPQVIEIIGTSPLPGQGIDRDALPYATQLIRRGEIDRAQAGHTTDLLARRLPGVQVNDVQGSPFQGDLTFRGFRASGLLGAAQGVSVYLDGVRINEAFGDVVNWDLLPEFALDSIALVPGANPAFGLNTLGGALAFTTVDGRSAPGLRGEASIGSFGRKQLSASYGGAHGDWQHYLGFGVFDEDGWRDHSDGRLGTVLGKLGRSTDIGEFTLSALIGRSRLVGNGLVPLYTFDEEDGSRTPDLGAGDRSAVYTHPDLTRNRLDQLSASWRHTLDGASTLEALVYLRDAERETINGDEAEEEEGEDDDDDDDGDDGDEANATFNRTATTQRGAGLALAYASRWQAHQWQAGLSLDHARMRYEQTEQAGEFDATRGVLPLDAPPELSARVRGRSLAFGLYTTDTWRVAERTHVTGTLRWNQAKLRNTLTTVDDDDGEIEERPTENFTYRSWNPALGVAHRLTGGVTWFANAARNTRVPTVIELGCADPEEPCRLPVGLQADPYLKAVRATTIEGGLRWGPAQLPAQGHGGSLTLYRTDNRNDILFSSVSVTGQLGYFRNFDRTRHQGLDAEFRWRRGPLQASLGYSHLQATYQAEGVLRIGERNVQVEPGTRIAGLPRHLLKAALDWQAAPGWRVGGDLQALSRRVSAGNEDGRFDDDDEETLDFSVPGYAIVNLHTSFAPAAVPGLELFARITNLFDRETASYGALAETLFDADGSYSGDERAAVFVAPGAPRAFTLGARMRF